MLENKAALFSGMHRFGKRAWCFVLALRPQHTAQMFAEWLLAQA
jgi:hypothetical protein